MKHFHAVFCMEPEDLVTRGDAALLVTADAPQDLVLPERKGFEGGGLIDRLGGAILKDVMRPPRVAGEDIAERAVVDHVGPGTVLLDDLPGTVEV